MEIKIAREDKQDTIIGQGNQILNKINNQKIMAQSVKSVQRGTCAITNGSTGKIATINRVNLSKSVLLTTGDMGHDGRAFLKTDGVYFEGRYSAFNGTIFWQVIEFY